MFVAGTYCAPPSFARTYKRSPPHTPIAPGCAHWLGAIERHVFVVGSYAAPVCSAKGSDAGPRYPPHTSTSDPVHATTAWPSGPSGEGGSARHEPGMVVTTLGVVVATCS